MATLKEGRYKNATGKPCRFVYTIGLDFCVYSGINPPGHGSTINFAEEVIQFICKQEGVHPLTLTFFDLQTASGFTGFAFRGPGNFQFDRVTFEVANNRPFRFRWVPTKCPPEIVHTFSSQIGSRPHQVSDSGMDFVERNQS